MVETGYKPVPHDAAFRKSLLTKPGVKKAFDALRKYAQACGKKLMIQMV